MPSSDTNIREKKLSQQKTPLPQDQRTSHQMKTRNVEQKRQKTPNQHLLRMRKKIPRSFRSKYLCRQYLQTVWTKCNKLFARNIFHGNAI